MGADSGRDDRQDEDNYAYAKAVDHLVGLAGVAIDPRREEGPDAEEQIHPAEIIRISRTGYSETGEQNDESANDPTVPRIGIRRSTVNPGRDEVPDASQQANYAGGSGGHQ